MSDKIQIEFRIGVLVHCDRNYPERPLPPGCFATFRTNANGNNEEEYVNNALTTVQMYGWFVSEDKNVILCSHCKNSTPQPIPSKLSAPILFPQFNANT